MNQFIEPVKKALFAMQRYSWEQGVAAQAFLELGETDWVILMAKEAVTRQAQDGRLAIMGDNHAVTDPAAIGEALLYAAKVTGDPKLKDAATKIIHYLLNVAPRRKEDGAIYHLDTKNQIWVDSFYMAPPFLAVAGYPEEAVAQIEHYRKLLWQPEKKLYAHIWDDDRQDFARKVCWGVGNGWAAAGMTRVIQALPERMLSEKQRLIEYQKEVVNGCLNYLRGDGLFHDVLDDPATFIETNAAQMIAYSIFRGVAGGWLDRAYLEPAMKMRAAATRKVDSYGLVQGVCGAPSFDHPGTAPEGQAFFLLMESTASTME